VARAWLADFVERGRETARFNRERGQTVLLVTHDAEVGASCDRIIHMRDGLIVADERVTETGLAA